MDEIEFEWDEIKNLKNLEKHGVDFFVAQLVFDDPYRIVAHDDRHSATEERLFCIGNVNGKILTVRFVKRGNIIRIIGAGEWRKWKKIYVDQHH